MRLIENIQETQARVMMQGSTIRSKRGEQNELKLETIPLQGEVGHWAMKAISPQELHCDSRGMNHREWLLTIRNKGEKLKRIARRLKDVEVSIIWGENNLEVLSEALTEYEDTITGVNQSMNTSEEVISSLGSKLHWYKRMAVKTEAAAQRKYKKAAQFEADHYDFEEEAEGRENHVVQLELIIRSL